MKLYSFSFPENTIAKYQQIIPPSKNKIIFREFLFNKYELPDSLDELQKHPSNPEVYPIRMNEQEIAKIDSFVSQANSKNVIISRSAVVRDVFQMIIEHNQSNPVAPREMKRSNFRVPIDTKKRLARFIDEGQRSYELSNFILDMYIPSNKFPPIREQAQESFDFVSEIETYERLDQIAEEYNFSNGRSKIFRDALLQFEAHLQENSPKKAMIEEKLRQALEDYSKIESKEAIMSKVSEFLKDK